MFRTNLQLEKCAVAFLWVLSLLFIIISSTISAQAEGPEFCWKDSYGRGAGTFPPQPPATQFRHWFSSELYSCPDGFYRKGNIDIVGKRYGYPVYSDKEEFLSAVKEKLSLTTDDKIV